MMTVLKVFFVNFILFVFVFTSIVHPYTFIVNLTTAPASVLG